MQYKVASLDMLGVRVGAIALRVIYVDSVAESNISVASHVKQLPFRPLLLLLLLGKSEVSGLLAFFLVGKLALHGRSIISLCEHYQLARW